MPRFAIALLLLLFSIRPVFADVAEDVGQYNTKSLPPAGSEPDISGVMISNTPPPEKTNAAYEYDVAEYTEETPRNILVWFQKIIEFFKDLFGEGVTEIGNRNAQNFLNARLPQGAGEQLLAGTYKSSDLAEGANAKVLGAVSDQAMDLAYDCAKCASLPLGLCDCGGEPTPTAADTSGGQTPQLPPSRTGELLCANQAPNSQLFVEKFREAAGWKSMPGAFVAGVACIEKSAMWNFTDSEVEEYSREGGGIPQCQPNAGGFRGPMQFNDASWQRHGFAATEALGRSTTNICNITDAFFAPVHKFDQDKNQRAFLGGPPANNTYCANATDDWSDPNLICCVASRFYRSYIPCTMDSSTGEYTTADCRRFYRIFGIPMNYCDFVTRFYNQWKNLY